MKKFAGLSKEMTIEEKVALLHAVTFFRSGGVERLSIPELVMSDGPNGVRQDFDDDTWMTTKDSRENVTWMPSNTCLASTWSTDLAGEFGEVLGEEARGRGKDIILAPGINIKRTPLCGRNFEYMGEDPVLVGEMVVPLIKGIQKHDVAACVKHFALNNQELERMRVEAKVDEKTLQEIYLPAFKKAVVDAGSYSIMGAYNRANGEYCCNNRHLFVDILRDMWKSDSVGISDWGGVQETDATADHGVDIEMSVVPMTDDYYMANPLIEKVKSGEIPESKIDEKVERVLGLMDKLRMGDPKRSQGVYNSPAHHEVVERVAEEGIVLLKNDTSHLPISPRRQDGTFKKILVVGDNAVRDNGVGGGSSEIHSFYNITPMLGLAMARGGDVRYKYLPGYYIDNAKDLVINDDWESANFENKSVWDNTSYTQAVENLVMYEPVDDRAPEEIEKDLNERIIPTRKKYRDDVLKVINDYDEVIFVGGLNHAYDVEGYDKKSITLPYAQDELIEAMADAAGEKLTVVLVCGSAVEMPWIDKVHSLLQLSYAGQNGGLALARVIYGDVNPSGHLPETYPIKLSDTPTEKYNSYPGEIGDEGHRVCEYTEKLMVGYRYYETEGVDVLFPFGYGLSYTTFEIDGVDACLRQTSDDGFEIEVAGTIKNTGNRTGKEVIQLYVGSPESDQPVKALKGFTKVEVRQGETVPFSICITKEDLATFDIDKNEFSTKSGEYKLYLGTNVRDIVYETKISCKIA